MAKSINIISDTTYASKAHGVHTAFLQHVRFCQEVLALDATVNNWFKPAEIDHHHTIGFYYWLFKMIHPRRQHVLHGHVVFDSLAGSIKLPGPVKQLAKWYLGFAYRLADKVVAVSEIVKKDLIDVGVDADKIVVIKNLVLPAVDKNKLSQDQAKKHIKLDPSRKMVLSVGQIQPRKRFDLFSDLAKGLPEVDFVWVGDTIFRSLGEGTNAMDKLKESTPPNVTLTGIVDYERTTAYYRAADVFVLLSDQENHPMAVLEAMNFDIPVMLRKVDFAEQNFKSASLTADDKQLKESLTTLLTDRKLQKNLIEKAHLYLQKDIIDKAKSQYTKLYQSVR